MLSMEDYLVWKIFKRFLFQRISNDESFRELKSLKFFQDIRFIWKTKLTQDR